MSADFDRYLDAEVDRYWREVRAEDEASDTDDAGDDEATEGED